MNTMNAEGLDPCRKDHRNTALLRSDEECVRTFPWNYHQSIQRLSGFATEGIHCGISLRIDEIALLHKRRDGAG